MSFTDYYIEINQQSYAKMAICTIFNPISCCVLNRLYWYLVFYIVILKLIVSKETAFLVSRCLAYFMYNQYPLTVNNINLLFGIIRW